MLVLNGLFSLLGRILLAAIFIVAGFQKAGDIGATAGYMASVGLPPTLAWPVAIFEIVAGLGILIGFFTRIFALLLAAFCVLSAIMFHNNFADPMQAAAFMKNLAIAGGFLVLFAYGNVAHSLDALRDKRRRELRERSQPRETLVERTPAGDRVVRDERVRHI